MNNIIDKILSIIPAIAVILLVVLVISIGKYRNVREDKANLEMLLDSTINHYETVVLENGQVISQQKQVITNLDNAVASGRVTIEELKARNLRKDATIIRLEKKIERLNIQASYTEPPDTIIVTTNDIPETYMKIPQEFTYKDTWDTIEGIVNLEGVTINRHVTRIKPTYYLSYQSQGFFKRPVPVVISEDKNPYVTVTGMQNTVIRKRPPFYKRPNWHRAEGAVGIVLIIETIKWLTND